MKITKLTLMGLCAVVAGVALAQVSGRAVAQTAETKKQAVQGKLQSGTELTFPKGTGTPSVECGECHQAIYREYAFGFGTDLAYKAYFSQAFTFNEIVASSQFRLVRRPNLYNLEVLKIINNVL